MAAIQTQLFGHLQDGTAVHKFVLTNANGMTVELISYGAAIKSVVVPNKKGTMTDVALGFDDLDGYLSSANPYFGCVVGRVANRLAKAQFSLNGRLYKLDKNNGENCLHGGLKGFDKVVWSWKVNDCRNEVCFSHLSPDGDQGFPGHVLVSVTYMLGEDNQLKLHFKAMTTHDTPINLANHVYLNLAGHDRGEPGLSQLQVTIDADFFIPVHNDTLIPDGRQEPVDGTAFDLRSAKTLAPFITKSGPPAGGEARGFDHCFVVSGKGPELDQLKRFCRFTSPESGITLEGFTDQPGVQFYTGNFMPTDGSLKGKGGALYPLHGAFCLETQKFPDAINQKSFADNSVLQPGQVYNHEVIYKFGTEQ